MRLKCGRKECRYEWDYKGKNKFWATCPRCLTKVKVNKKEEKEDGKRSE